MRASPWLEFAGVELANANRTLTYLRRGFAGVSWNVALRSPRYTEGNCGYDDIYSAFYEGDCHYSPRNLACYCEATSERSYDSPAGAPWYDPDRPESYDFLGILPMEIDVQPVLSRATTARSRGGGSVGRLRPTERAISVKGTMFASNPQGMAWGERWLTQALTGEDPAAGCAHDVVRVLPSCPEEPDVERFFREIHAAGVTAGPTFGPIQSIKGCSAQDVSFLLVGGSEYLFRPAFDAMAVRPLTPTLHHALIEAPLYFGAAAVVTLWAGVIGSSLRDVTIRIAPTTASVCPSVSAPSFTFEVDYVPRGGHIVIDASRRRVVVYDEDGDIYGGLDSVTFSSSWQWAAVDRADQICVTIDATTATLNPGSLVQVEQVDREL